MLKRVIPAMLACVLFAASGCDTVKPYWKGTKKFYKEYVNVDPSIDLKDPGDSDPSVRKLAALFAPVDEHLEFLLRSLSAQDLPPEREWCQAFMDAFPWLSGMAVLTDTGLVSFKLPTYTIKPIDYAPLLEFEKLYKNRKMAAYVAASELGSEVLVAKPLFVNNEYKGLLVVSFDPGNLAKFSPEPGQLMIFAPGATLWTGDNAAACQSLAQLNWKNIFKSDVAGEQAVGGTRYLWQSRFVAQARLIYAVSAAQAPAKPAKAEAKPQPAPAPAQ
ncbi:MAG: hypothetical protein HY795_17875 [Desulfovibrio sp.]|nr:hypothetical protein [Desulfovibrio sp.]MBI4959910.1 hypothetical protein [Desulfovibrio sp.]